MPSFGPSPVEEIKQRLDVAEVLSEYVKLLPSGTGRFKVLCPFHSEKTPSLMVSKERQGWHCFGCGKGGDVFTFVQEIEGVEFPEALRLLAKKANVELRPVDPKLHNAKTRLLDVLRLSAAFYRKVLTDGQTTEAAREYLRQRNVSSTTAEDFQLGYAPTTWDALLTFLRKKGHSDQEAFDAGLAVKRERGVGGYDRFRGRLMFPIRDVNGTVVGFGGRIMEAVEGDASSAAKYINTPETLIYQKGSLLYGLDRAKQSIKRADQAVLVEGYMDCLASHQAGVTNVVAVSGTALTERQVRLLKRYTTNVALAFDADLAGGEAARRGIDQALSQDLRVTVITLPDGAKDPDELVQRDPAAWRNAIGRSQRIIDYAFDQAFRLHDPSDVDGKKAIAKRLLPVLKQLVDPVEQSHYVQLLGQRLGTDEQSLRQALQRTTGPRPVGRSAATAEAARPKSDRVVQTAERLLAIGLFSTPDHRRELTEHLGPELLPDGELRALYNQALVYYSQQHDRDGSGLSEFLRHDLPMLGQRVSSLAMMAERELSDHDVPTLRRELQVGISFLKRHRLGEEVRRVETALRAAELKRDGPESDRLLAELNTLTDELALLDR